MDRQGAVQHGKVSSWLLRVIPPSSASRLPFFSPPQAKTHAFNCADWRLRSQQQWSAPLWPANPEEKRRSAPAKMSAAEEGESMLTAHTGGCRYLHNRAMVTTLQTIVSATESSLQLLSGRMSGAEGCNLFSKGSNIGHCCLSWETPQEYKINYI